MLKHITRMLKNGLFVTIILTLVLNLSPVMALDDVNYENNGQSVEKSAGIDDTDGNSINESEPSPEDDTLTKDDADTAEEEDVEKTHPVSELKARSLNFEEITLSWKGDYDRYKVYRVSGSKWIKIAEVSGTTYTDKGLRIGSKYSYKIETDVMSNVVSTTVISQKTASLSMIKSGSNRFDIRIAARQKLYGYDTIQGACSYKGYAYMALYNRKRERVRIAKLNLNTMKVVKVSPVLKSRCHADTLTYNPKTNRIIACCGKGSRKRISIINASTLKQVSTKTFKISKKFIGGTYSGVSGIAYNREKDLYVMKLRGSANKIVLLDKNFKVKKYVKIEGNRSYLLAQGIYTEGNYMYDLQSFKGNSKYNLVTVRRLDGKLAGRIIIPSGTSGQLYELENIFHEKGKWYCSFYRAHVRKKGKGDTDRKNYLYTFSF